MVFKTKRSRFLGGLQHHQREPHEHSHERESPGAVDTRRQRSIQFCSTRPTKASILAVICRIALGTHPIDTVRVLCSSFG